ITLGDGADHAIAISVSGTDLVVTVDGDAPESHPIADVTALTITGGDQADTFTITGLLPVPVTIHAGGGTDTLQAPDEKNLWLVTGAGSGSLNSYGASQVVFDGVENLGGGSLPDLTVYGPGGSISGAVPSGLFDLTIPLGDLIDLGDAELEFDIDTAV